MSILYMFAVLLKDKVRHIKHFELEENPFQTGSTKLKLVRSVPPSEAWGETLRENRWKQGKEIIDWR